MKSTRRNFLQTIGATGAAVALVPPAGRSKIPSAPIDSPSNPQSDICSMRATDIAALIREKKLSAREVMQAHLRQIEQINPKVNAIVTQVSESQLLAQAQAADEAVMKGRTGSLHGIPIGVKDIVETKGIRTTYGSPLYKNFVPDYDALVVERVKNAGAIVIGKTNVPEFAVGPRTWNPVFGATFNPYDLTKTCGGSTGGGAVALACGMVPLANGTDMGGSLRIPGNFCNVVGLRPSPGRVPNYPSQLGWTTFSVPGPMARNVTDCALLLSVFAGFDRRCPISVDQPGGQFAVPLSRNFKDVRVAMVRNWELPWEPEVIEAIHAQRKVFESLGCIVEDAEPDMRDANECFLAWRNWSVELKFGEKADAQPEQFNDYIRGHVAEGRKLSGSYLSRVEAKRTALYHRMRQFMEMYEFFILPVNQVLPFDVNTPYPTEVAGVKMTTYIDAFRSTYYISAIGNPAISVPCTFSQSGLPIGIQIVGRHNDDLGVLQMAFAFEQATNVGKRRPPIV